MKGLKKLLTGILAGAMALSITFAAGSAMTANAATIDKVAGVTGDASITVNLPAGRTTNNTYKIYKVFDATVSGDNNIAYTLTANHTNVPAGFTQTNGYVSYTGDSGANLSADEIASIKKYVTEADVVATVVATKDDASFTVSGLPLGYYFINTTTGSLVIINTTKGTVSVDDKNSVPTVDKTITKVDNATTFIDEAGKKALAEVGKKVEYSAKIVVGKGSTNLVFHDKMTSGLTYNNDVAWTAVKDGNAVTVNGTKSATGDDTITVNFADGIEAGTVITVTYSATVNATAVTTDSEKNTAYVSYGDGNKTTESSTEVYDAEISVLKYDGKNTDTTDDDTALAGAGFVLKNSAGKYYKVDKGIVTWVDKQADADVHTSADDGKVPAFTGLTGGKYTLEEVVVPAGYNKSSDTEVTITGEGDTTYTATNLKQQATVINNAGSVLPSTGGIGTTIFYIIGGLLIVAAVVFFVVRRRADAE